MNILIDLTIRSNSLYFHFFLFFLRVFHFCCFLSNGEGTAILQNKMSKTSNISCSSSNYAEVSTSTDSKLNFLFGGTFKYRNRIVVTENPGTNKFLPHKIVSACNISFFYPTVIFPLPYRFGDN